MPTENNHQIIYSSRYFTIFKTRQKFQIKNITVAYQYNVINNISVFTSDVGRGDHSLRHNFGNLGHIPRVNTP
jgi:hypothetical protein